MPSTPPVRLPPHEPAWPPGVLMPPTAEATYTNPEAVTSQLARVAKWNAAQVRGECAPRPAAKAWSDQARLPWCRGR
eukprot:5948310-Pleurochrysis_carterae.AAC.1